MLVNFFGHTNIQKSDESIFKTYLLYNLSHQNILTIEVKSIADRKSKLLKGLFGTFKSTTKKLLLIQIKYKCNLFLSINSEEENK